MFIIKKKENSIYLKFVNKYIVLDEITDYNCFNIKDASILKVNQLK